MTRSTNSTTLCDVTLKAVKLFLKVLFKTSGSQSFMLFPMEINF